MTTPLRSRALLARPLTDPRLMAAAAALLAVIAYSNALHNPFVFDDRTEVIENSSITDLRNLRAVLQHSITRPVVNLSYAFDYALWGPQPFGFHLTNLVLHVFNVVLLFVVALRAHQDWQARKGSGRTAWDAHFALFVAALFAVHPLLSEAVGYVSGRSELLCAFFSLLALLAARIAFLQRGGRRLLALAGSLVCLLLGLASKEVAVMFPFVMLAYDRLLIPGSLASARRRLWRFHIPLIALFVVLGLARVVRYLAAEHPTAPTFLWSNTLVELHVLVRYLELLLLPVGQSAVHAVYPITSVADPRALLAVANVAVLVGLAVLLRRTDPLVTFGITWFLCLLIPSSSLIVLAERGQPMAEHRLYFASGGFFIGLGAVLAGVAATLRERGIPRWLPAAAATLVLAVLIGLTQTRNRVWSDPVTLWGEAARRAPRTWAAQYALADALGAAGSCDEAIPVFRRAIALLPTAPKAYYGLASCLADQGRFAEARDILSALLRSDPRNIKTRQMLTEIFEAVYDDPAEALRLCREIDAIEPGLPTTRDCIERNVRKLGELR